jgi:hypothetical protein
MARSLEAMRPQLDRQATRPRYWLPSFRFGGIRRLQSTNSVTQRDSGLRGWSVAGEPVMESRQEEQTVELDVEQGRKSLAQLTCGSPQAAQDTES